MYVTLLGKALKGTMLSIVANNLGAHRKFSGDFFCRFWDEL